MPRLKSYYFFINQYDLIDKNLILISISFFLNTSNFKTKITKSDFVLSILFYQLFFAQNYNFKINSEINIRDNFFFNFIDILLVSSFLNHRYQNHFTNSFNFFKDFIFKKFNFLYCNLNLKLCLSKQLIYYYNNYCNFYIH